MPDISDLNESSLIGQRWAQDGYEVVIIWHQALGEVWPDEEDIIYFVYEIDGNEASVQHCNWYQFQRLFKEVQND